MFEKKEDCPLQRFECYKCAKGLLICIKICSHWNFTINATCSKRNNFKIINFCLYLVIFSFLKRCCFQQSCKQPIVALSSKLSLNTLLLLLLPLRKSYSCGNCSWKIGFSSRWFNMFSLWYESSIKLTPNVHFCNKSKNIELWNSTSCGKKLISTSWNFISHQLKLCELVC